ncbi:MAG: hypothetical protein KDC69_02845 [Flavobacteriaceae bacterium]|nr:hypothetical protein [Flavobacteriaceae bacterium]
MIEYLTRNKLDIIKYDQCIARAVNSHVYAYSWYLDSVCDDWDALVAGDYNMVMPLPKRRKFGINYVYVPPWTQQLGVFSKEELNESTVVAFLKAIPRKFKFVELKLNSANAIFSKKISQKDNYILSLDADFQTIVKNYNHNRRRISGTIPENIFLERNLDSGEFLTFYKRERPQFTIPQDADEKLEQLVKHRKSGVNIWAVYRGGELLSTLLWLKDRQRITYLLPVNSAAGKKANTATYIINHLVEEYENTGLIFDFEGSMLTGVAGFYKSFGARKETYYHFRSYRL